MERMDVDGVLDLGLADPDRELDGAGLIGRWIDLEPQLGRRARTEVATLDGEGDLDKVAAVQSTCSSLQFVIVSADDITPSSRTTGSGVTSSATPVSSESHGSGSAGSSSLAGSGCMPSVLSSPSGTSSGTSSGTVGSAPAAAAASSWSAASSWWRRHRGRRRVGGLVGDVGWPGRGLAGPAGEEQPRRGHGDAGRKTDRHAPAPTGGAALLGEVSVEVVVIVVRSGHTHPGDPSARSLQFWCGLPHVRPQGSARSPPLGSTSGGQP